MLEELLSKISQMESNINEMVSKESLKRNSSKSLPKERQKTPQRRSQFQKNKKVLQNLNEKNQLKIPDLHLDKWKELLEKDPSGKTPTIQIYFT